MFKRGVDYELTEFEFVNCLVQGELFLDTQYPPNNKDAVDFITKYLNSELVAEIDKDFSPFSGWGAAQLEEQFLLFCDVKPLDENNRIDDKCLEWAGFIYRYWNRWLGESSREIVVKCPVEKMLSCYVGLYTLSPEEAIRMIKRATV